MMISQILKEGGKVRKPNDTKPVFCCERARSRRRGGVGAGTGVGSAAVRGGDTTAFLFSSPRTQQNNTGFVALGGVGG